MKPYHLALSLSCVFLASCQAVAGLKDREYDSADGGTESGPKLATAAMCKDYCDVLMSTCQDPQQVYPTKQGCMNVCMRLPAGKGSDPTGNTVACRAKIAHAANIAQEGLEESCPKAGPGGANACGSDCESYCYLYAKACPKDALDNCEAKCKGLTDKATFDAVTADHDGDTLQCRLVHVSNAFGDPDTHCKHARIVHPDGYCADPPESDLDCNHYCRLVSTACGGDDRVYESPNQCKAVCAALGPGKIGDQSADPMSDTVACRLWHAYTAMLDPQTHCAHAGPGGDGHCGDGSDFPNCAPYCRILQNACPDQFEAAFDDDAEKCNVACSKLDGAEPFAGYSVKGATSDAKSLQCRMLYATRAASGDEGACDDAFGDGKTCHD